MKTPFAFCIILFAGLLQAASAQFSVYGTLLDDRHALPGTTYDGSLTLVNESTHSQQVNIYLKAPGEVHARGRSNANWISFYPESFVLEAGTRRDIFYTVAVPERYAGVEVSGSYWSSLVIEEVVGAKEMRKRQKSGALPLRYEIALATHISGATLPELAIRSISVVEEKGLGLYVEAHIENTGDTMLKPEGWLELYDTSGSLVGRIVVDKNRMNPGATTVQRVKVQDIAPGVYEALLVLDAGGDHIFGGQYSIQLATDQVEATGPVH